MKTPIAMNIVMEPGPAYELMLERVLTVDPWALNRGNLQDTLNEKYRAQLMMEDWAFTPKNLAITFRVLPSSNPPRIVPGELALFIGQQTYQPHYVKSFKVDRDDAVQTVSHSGKPDYTVPALLGLAAVSILAFAFLRGQQ